MSALPASLDCRGIGGSRVQHLLLRMPRSINRRKIQVRHSCLPSQTAVIRMRVAPPVHKSISSQVPGWPVSFIGGSQGRVIGPSQESLHHLHTILPWSHIASTPGKARGLNCTDLETLIEGSCTNTHLKIQTFMYTQLTFS